ncbi:MAG TPA: hypothetical protein VLC52_08395, partial [Anaerolineae bacterium]|nr:hypothetical protein [Anaerolineae bacterium]
SATAGPGEPTAAPLPTATRTSQPPAPGATPEPLPTPLLVGDEPEGAAAGSSQGAAGGLTAVLLSPCLWIGLGLLLMAAGAAILLTRRRAR